MACDCKIKFDALYAEHNGRLATNFLVNSKTGTMRESITIAVEKIDKKVRRRPPTVIPTFCPFCGVRYLDVAPMPEAAT